MNESKPPYPYMDLTSGYVDPISKYYIDRMWEEYHKVKNDLAAVRIDASSAWQEYHKMKEELAVAKSKLGQAEDYINETLKPELADSRIKLKMAQSAWDELDKSHAARAMLHDELIIAEGQRDQWKMKYETAEAEACQQRILRTDAEGLLYDANTERDAAYDARRNADIYAQRYEEQAMSAEAERDEWKKKYEAAVEHNRKLRAYNESLVALIEAAQELENSYHDIYVVNKVRQASANIRETWEDTRARCS